MQKKNAVGYSRMSSSSTEVESGPSVFSSPRVEAPPESMDFDEVESVMWRKVGSV